MNQTKYTMQEPVFRLFFCCSITSWLFLLQARSIHLY